MSALVPFTMQAQGANVDVTVIPSYSAGQTAPARDGFTVCIGTTSNYALYGTQLTPLNGVANTAFKNLPVGQQVVIRVNKAGYVGVERTTTLQADWSNHIQMQPQSGSGGPSCPTTSGTTPTPTPTSPPPVNTPPKNPPPPLTGDFVLRVVVGGGPQHRLLPNAQVCIGPKYGPADGYAKVKPTDSQGSVIFSHLPTLTEYRVTAAKAGYIGNIVDAHPRGTNDYTTLNIELGSGGPTCPNMDMSYDVVTAIPLPPTPANATPPSTSPPPPPPPAHLGQEILSPHGHFLGGNELVKTLDCKSFGSDFVMVAIDGKHGLAIDRMRIGCARVFSNATLGNTVWSGYAGYDNIAFNYTRSCGPNQAVVGINGWTDANQVRGIQIRCRPITGAGLVTGSTTVLERVGGNPGTAWGPDNCSSARPARAIKLGMNVFTAIPSAAGPYVIEGVQLICEQPIIQ